LQHWFHSTKMMAGENSFVTQTMSRSTQPKNFLLFRAKTICNSSCICRVLLTWSHIIAFLSLRTCQLLSAGNHFFITQRTPCINRESDGSDFENILSGIFEHEMERLEHISQNNNDDDQWAVPLQRAPSAFCLWFSVLPVDQDEEADSSRRPPNALILYFHAVRSAGCQQNPSLSNWEVRPVDRRPLWRQASPQTEDCHGTRQIQARFSKLHLQECKEEVGLESVAHDILSVNARIPIRRKVRK
jgi:hypothetical protein